MKPSNHMDLGDPLIQRVSRRALNFRNRHLERMGIASACTESAKLAGKHANIGVIDVTVQDIACPVAVFSLADDIGDLAEGIKIIRPKQSKGLLLVDTFSVEDLLVNVLEGLGDQPRGYESLHKRT